ncbi:MAG: Rho termination factor N-terminal domain-containing protein, partial [Tannerellaceae bacterium]|nr:Rho termination factor N-terminal domain-containing protein [Tannerellaceae bacterium]
MQKYNILELNEKLLTELQAIASELGIKKAESLKKEELVYRILDEQAISYAGIQAEKEKEKEAKKVEKLQAKAKNPQAKSAPKAKSPRPNSEKEANAKPSMPSEPKIVNEAAVKPTPEVKTITSDETNAASQPERKKRIRIEKKEKVAGATIPADKQDQSVVVTT